jgi:deoxyribodipyrimidine photo-lyase
MGMIQPERVRKLNERSIQKSRFILYWMQASQRVEYNHALEYAIRQANEQSLPVVTLFVLTEKFPGANLRHYTFMLEGLREIRTRLEEEGISFFVLQGSPEREVIRVSRQASMVVTDCGYLRVQK